MSAQISYNATPVVGFKGMLAEQFSQRQVDSYIAEGAIIAGDAVERGTNQTVNMQSAKPLATAANVIGIALFSLHQEVPNGQGGTTAQQGQSAKLVFPTVFVASDVINAYVNNTLYSVPFNTDNATTLGDLATALAADGNIATATDVAPDTILLVGVSGVEYTASATVVNTGVQTSAATFEVTENAGQLLVYQDKGALPVLARGRVYAKAGGAVTTGAEVVPSTGANTVWTAGAGAGTTKAYARTAAGAAGDIFIIELVGP